MADGLIQASSKNQPRSTGSILDCRLFSVLEIFGDMKISSGRTNKWNKIYKQFCLNYLNFCQNKLMLNAPSNYNHNQIVICNLIKCGMKTKRNMKWNAKPQLKPISKPICRHIEQLTYKYLYYSDMLTFANSKYHLLISINLFVQTISTCNGH